MSEILWILVAVFWVAFVLVVGTADKFASYSRKEWTLLSVFAPFVALGYVFALLIGLLRQWFTDE